MPDELTAQQQLDALAAEMVPCPCDSRTHGCGACGLWAQRQETEGHCHGCEDCSGTGTVARFPMLRVSCIKICHLISEKEQVEKIISIRFSSKYNSQTRQQILDEFDGAKCQECAGRGWHPKQVEDVHLEDVTDAGLIINAQVKVTIGYLHGKMLGAIAALYAAVQAQEKKEAHE